MTFGPDWTPRRALVLAGGGVAGIAWEIGVLRGVADVDRGLAEAVMGADVVIGTSAGSAVGAQITSGTPIDRLYDLQLEARTAEIRPTGATQDLEEVFAALVARADSPADLRRRIGRAALAARTVEPERRLAAVRARLPIPDWSDADLRLVMVDAITGDRVVVDRFSGISLLDAVAASCAVPGAWPPVRIAGVPYVDGGVWSGTNADLASGARVVVVITPSVEDVPHPLVRGLPAEIAELRAGGTRSIEVIRADEAAVAAFAGDTLDPATRAPSAEAGRDLGRAVAHRLTEVWV